MADRRPFSLKDQKDVPELTRSMEQFSLQPRYSVAEILATPQFDVTPVAEKDTLDVTVLTIEKSSQFVCPVSWEQQRQLFLAQLNVAVVFMDRYFNGWSRSRVDVNPQNNGVYAALLDDTWFRVRVLCADPSKFRAKVYSLDYGWTKFIKFSDFRHLPLDFITKKPLGEEIFLLGSAPYLHVGNRISLEFVDKDMGKWRVKLMSQTKLNCSLAQANGNDLGQAPRNHCVDDENGERTLNMKSSGPESGNRGKDCPQNSDIPSGEHKNSTRKNGSHHKQPPKGNNYFSRKENHSNFQSGGDLARTSRSEVHADRDQTTSGPTALQSSRSDGRKHGGQGGVRDKSTEGRAGPGPRPSEGLPGKRVRYRDTRLPARKASTIVVVHSGREGVFAISERDINNFAIIEDMLKKVEKNNYSITFPSINKLCLAPYCDGIYRARVIQVSPEKFMCRVLFVDYGNEADVSMKDVKEFPEDLPEDIYTFKIDYEGPPYEPVPDTRLKVVPMATTKDGTIEVQIQEE